MKHSAIKRLVSYFLQQAVVTHITVSQQCSLVFRALGEVHV